jgi:hypothetical protein
MASETETPNIGLQVPSYDQGNWQVPTNFNWNLLDLIFGGEVTVPALSVLSLTIGNIGAALAPYFVSEQPAGAVPGTVYTLNYTPALVLGIFYNGVLQRLGIDYTMVGAAVTLGFSTQSGDVVYALYFKV